MRTSVTEQCASAAASGPGEHGEHEQRVHGDRGDRGEDEHRSERGVDGHEPPRVPVQVGDGEPESTTRAHPFTPAETTPETKKRWKARKMTRIGRIAMTAAGRDLAATSVV